MASLITFAALAASLGKAYAQAQLTVNVGSTLQQIDGFGVSQAFGRAAEFRDMLSGSPQRQGLDYLFNTTTGAGLTIIRNRIGSSPVASDCILPKNPGGPSATPDYVFDEDDRSQAYANLLVQYVKFYAERGMPITQVGFLNEPDYVASYSSMQSGVNEAASFIPILYNTLERQGFGNVSIACCDAMGWNTQRTMTQGLISQGVEKYLGYITSHMYTGDPNSPINTRLKTWQTEGADLNSRWCATWYGNGGLCEGMTWANKIHTGLASANLSAYIYWQGVEVNQFQASSYLVASDGKIVTPSGRLWAFAMWSRFVRPGAYRVATSGSVSSTGVTAFRNTDGSVVVVFLNNGGGQQSVRVSFNGFAPAVAEAYVTDNSRSMVSTNVALSGSAITVSVPARGMLTVKLTASV
ncbi:hypothetical protein DL766_000463 [Monosporascus sp. MC13-8B]|uniref:Glycosyl hydrolase family 30 beta sandwich domain-containing protein n=1 Tax=Monosporascus cannonballus TaxID=155416 RepID=A0ABY0HGL5_9PEZI|nr:hypothetical protein DL762_002426 [Monosporascus cannonballus]RYP00191.1 hypothetical protein DL763_000960 [Monosporascus cannonballus]RYP39311.1 hypothetical protein DL766_000463 [Monosporascus sp. MC13-8B]